MQDIDLTVRPQSRDELTAWYTAALEDQARSGQSMADYAEDLGVAPATLYQWKRRLSSDDAAAFETAGSVGLVELSIADLSPAEVADPIIVRLGHGRWVELPRRFDDEALIQIIGILESC